MNGFHVAMHEWAHILRNKKITISVIAVLLIPLLYSYLYLWAFWDPYERLDRLPVAVVNQDTGAELKGEKLRIGQDLVEKLKEDPKLNWDFTTEDNARQGLKNGKYYLMVQIPPDFSKKATTASNDHPEPTEIFYIPNESRNLLASQLGERAMESLRSELQQKITAQYLTVLFEQMGSVENGLQEASNGAAKISDGLFTVQNGTGRLSNGSTVLSAGVVKLAKGTVQLSDGLNNLENGLQQAYTGSSQVTAGLDQLKKKGQELSGSAKQLATGMKQTNQALARLTPKSNELNQGLRQLSGLTGDASVQWKALLQRHPELIQEPEAQTLSQEIGGLSANLPKMAEGSATMADHLNQIQSAVGQIGNGSQQLSAGIDQYTAAVGQAKAGSEKVTTGSQKLYVGARQLSTGVASLTKGTDLLAAGASKLQNGAADLQDGVTQLAKGSGELSGKLDEGAAKLKDSLKNTDDKAQMIANPVELKQKKVYPVPNYGTGFSPYFISLALYVGALLLFIVLDVREVVVAPKRATSWLFGKFMVYSTLGIL